MNRSKTALLFALVFVALGLMAAVPAMGDQIVFDFIGHDDEYMDVPWTEQGLELVVHAIPGGYHMAAGTLYGMSIGYAELSIDVSSLPAFRAVDAVIKTNFENNDSYLSLATADGVVATVPNTVYGTPETLTLTRGSEDIVSVRVGGISLLLSEVTLRYGNVPTDRSTWSRMKSLFR